MIAASNNLFTPLREAGTLGQRTASRRQSAVTPLTPPGPRFPAGRRSLAASAGGGATGRRVVLDGDRRGLVPFARFGADETRTMRALNELLTNNRAWAAAVTRDDPEFFQRLARQQAPEYLWIGCSDSRVPANQIVGLRPGEMFVHRNVANVVVHTDLNCLSTVQFAVDVLRVKHIIVCGHYGCGGVNAALSDQKLGLIDNWLRHVQDVRSKHQPLLDAAVSEPERLHRLCELNVMEQVLNVSKTTVVRDAWTRGQELAVHGWIYDVADGLLRDLGMTLHGEADIPLTALVPNDGARLS
jgi:carbonic anhydrase